MSKAKKYIYSVNPTFKGFETLGAHIVSDAERDGDFYALKALDDALEIMREQISSAKDRLTALSAPTKKAITRGVVTVSLYYCNASSSDRFVGVNTLDDATRAELKKRGIIKTVDTKGGWRLSASDAPKPKDKE